MLRIESVRTMDGPPRLRLEGRVIGPWVEELRRASEPALAHRTGLVLDLSEVDFVDRDGLELLSSLSRRGAELLCSSFVAEQLKARERR